MTSPNITIVTDANFEQEVLKSDKPVVIDFYADWCGPCKAFAPTLEKFADAHPEVKVVKINVDDSPKASSGIRSIPTIALLEGSTGVVIAQGNVSLKQLEENLKDGFDFLKNPPTSEDRSPKSDAPKGPRP